MHQIYKYVSLYIIIVLYIILVMSRRVCAAFNCSNYEGICGKSFFRFPRDDVRCRKWLINCRRKDLDCFLHKNLLHLHNNYRLCSDHFEDSQFMNADTRQKLIWKAVPTLFNVPNPPQRLQSHRHYKRGRQYESEVHPTTGSGQTTLVSISQPGEHGNATTVDVPSVLATTSASLHSGSSELSTLITAMTVDHNYVKLKKQNAVPDTPRKTALRKTISRQRVVISRLRRKVRFHCSKGSTPSSDTVLMNHPVVKFFGRQLKLHTRNKHGRRYAVQDKNFALSLYYASPKAYKLCAKMFCLPSVTMIRLWLRRMSLQPGFCNSVYHMLSRKIESMPADDRCCALLLDEISLKRAVTYVKSTDHIVGFEDFGDGNRTKKYATQALVLMVRGLKSHWKQPVAYFLACNSTPAAMLKKFVSDVVVKLKSAGLTVVCVICDQGATNMQMFRMFGVTTDSPCADIDGQTVFFMFDPPHLLKSVRNNLVKHSFDVDGKLVKWQYISQFFEADHKQTVKLAPKLTHKHINLPPFANMRVCLAAQIFSHSVAAGIYTHVAFGAMPSDAAFTAKFIDVLDGLFDCFNAGSFCGPKPYRRALAVNSKHWQFLSDCKKMFLTLSVVGGRTKPPCIDGFVLSINALTQLFSVLREQYGFKFLLTNRLNQDALENHFAVIRSRGGFRDNPDPSAFQFAFRQVLVQHLLDTPKDANCSDDLTTFMLNIQDVGSGGKLPTVSVVMSPQSDMPGLLDDESITTSLVSVVSVDSLNELCDKNVCELNAVSYVAGYVVKTILTGHNCLSCREMLLLAESSTNQACVFFDFKLYEGYSSSSLHTPSELAVEIFCRCRQIFVNNFETVMHGNAVLQSLFRSSLDTVTELLSSVNIADICMREAIQKAVALFLRILLYHKVKVLNRDMSCATGTSGKRNRKAMKVVHN